jgi:hypothetical protein
MPPKEFEMGTGYLYDEDGNCLGSLENITNIKEIECESEEENDIIERYNNIGCTSFTFTIDSFLVDTLAFLTKRQSHLYKYGKYRVRKKYANKICKMIKKNIGGLK